jgi:hypothetical protein
MGRQQFCEKWLFFTKFFCFSVIKGEKKEKGMEEGDKKGLNFEK